MSRAKNVGKPIEPVKQKRNRASSKPKESSPFTQGSVIWARYSWKTESIPRESALGWALRAAELNALPDALKLATLCKNFHATTSLVNFNPGELASWFDKAPSILGFMSYRSLTKTSPLCLGRNQLRLRCWICELRESVLHVLRKWYIHAFLGFRSG